MGKPEDKAEAGVGAVQAAQEALAKAQAAQMGTCPNCGYCPHCGRATAPRLPWPYTYPYGRPRPLTPYWQSPSWQQSPNQCVSARLGTVN